VGSFSSMSARCCCQKEKSAATRRVCSRRKTLARRGRERGRLASLLSCWRREGVCHVRSPAQAQNHDHIALACGEVKLAILGASHIICLRQYLLGALRRLEIAGALSRCDLVKVIFYFVGSGVLLWGLVWCRSRVQQCAHLSESDKRREQAERLVALFFAVRLALVALAFCGLAFYIREWVGEQFVFQGLTLGVAIAIFVALQLPQLLPPSYLPYFITGGEHGCLVNRNGTTVVSLQAERQSQLVFFFVSNTGVNSYRNWECWITLPEQLTVVPYEDSKQYGPVQDFLRPFKWSPSNNSVYFSGETVSPGSVVALALLINASQDQGKYACKVEFTCQSRSGSCFKNVHIRVV